MNRLSSDIILELVPWIDQSEHKTLRLISKTFTAAMESTFWANRFVALVARESVDLERLLLKLEEMRNNPSSSQKIQGLRFNLSVIDQVGMEELCQKVEKVLPEALSKLQGLRRASWIDPGWAIETVTQSLASLPLLADLTISQREWRAEPSPNLPLHHFRRGTLERLLINTSYEDRDGYLSSLSILLAHNPCIRHLELLEWQFPPTIPLVFNELFQRQPIFRPLRLESLHLFGWRLTPEVIPHLRSLRSLEFDGHAELPNLTFWKTLETENIHLRRIVTVPYAPLLDYLDTFSGLEVLAVLEDRWHTEDLKEAEVLARRFYQVVLPKHKASLKELSFRSVGPNIWNVSEWNLEGFNGYRELRTLEVEICEDDIHATSNPEKHIVGALVKRLIALPKFQRLTLRPLFHGREGTGFVGEGISQLSRILDMKVKLGEVVVASVIQVTVDGIRAIYFPEIIEGEIVFKCVSNVYI
ncbi:hypothetical protein E1B28_001847 [Marasmius oreades]|uniref:F-box domain-containing protein n=1 Tax=Marasmius oreades TaxID=181124 RepID=A0A9P8AFU5_9AGAR|nr:uncharacterized protein E1B28_001847 [Marasmius oreades]KAG7100062.1 hypothetical protein E1B28_001847 [Marasmius oreades]